jgi:hypothetical protein
MKRMIVLGLAALFLVQLGMVTTAGADAPKQAFATFKMGGIHSGTCDYAGQIKELYIYGLNINEFYTAVEYRLVLCGCLMPIGVVYHSNTVVTNGNPWTGVQQAFYPPINGFFPGLDLWATVFVQCGGSCDDCSGDNLLFIDEHPVSQAIQGTRADKFATLFPIVGLTTILCPNSIGTEETTWGKVKALYSE